MDQPHSDTAISVRNIDFYYGDTHSLRNVTMDIPRHQVTAFIGPSGCGKSTLLRCFNRMNDFIPEARVRKGQILINDTDIHSPCVDGIELRRNVGMVFQKSNPFPRSIYENVAYGPRILGDSKKSSLDAIIEKSLRGAGLWDEVKNRLHESAYSLSGGQQQRLCIARAIAVEPSILLMDEPCSALDPIATAAVEELIKELAERFTIVIVTHNMQQAQRVSHQTAFFYLGELIEYAPTATIFGSPSDTRTQQYIAGKFG